MANIEAVSTQIRKRRWRYIGHVLRKSADSNERIAPRWTLNGRRRRGRPKETWRRTVEKERNKMGLSC